MKKSSWFYCHSIFLGKSRDMYLMIPYRLDTVQLTQEKEKSSVAQCFTGWFKKKILRVHIFRSGSAFSQSFQTERSSLAVDGNTWIIISWGAKPKKVCYLGRQGKFLLKSIITLCVLTSLIFMDSYECWWISVNYHENPFFTSWKSILLFAWECVQYFLVLILEITLSFLHYPSCWELH